MRPLFNGGPAINRERIERIETIVTRIARRSRDVARTIVTPYPISNAVISEGAEDVSLEGVILRYMFPHPGNITKGCVKFGSKPKDSVTLDMKIFSEDTFESQGFTTNKKSANMKYNLPVKSGDCLEVSLIPLKESVVKEVWISLLWVPDSGYPKEFLIDELEKNVTAIAEGSE